jgi:flagellar protein FlaJ
MKSPLQTNIEQALALATNRMNYQDMLERAEPAQRKLLNLTIESLNLRIKVILQSLPSLAQQITVASPLTPSAEQKPLPLSKIETPDSTTIIKKEDKETYLKALRISEKALAKLREGKVDVVDEGEAVSFQASRGYVKLASALFGSVASKLIAQGTFRTLGVQLRKSNMSFLLEGYVSMILFTSVLSILCAFALGAFFHFFSLTLSPPSVIPYTGPFLPRLFLLLGMTVIFPIATFFALYYYPTTEQEGAKSKIEQELPFAIIHMSAISGSGIEPSNIFAIIAESKEYPAMRREIRKVLTHMRVYGYDLVSALNTIAQSTPSPKLAEIFAGLSATITSGGDLKTFFEKRAESLLLEYKLDREKFAKTAETFMDIYITVVIAAPMILLLILIMLNISNFSIGLSPGWLTALIIGVIAVLNIVFMSFLNVKQPGY